MFERIISKQYDCFVERLNGKVQSEKENKKKVGKYQELPVYCVYKAKCKYFCVVTACSGVCPLLSHFVYLLFILL